MVDTGGGYYTVVMTKPFIDAHHVQERTGTVVSQVSDTPGLVLAAARPTAVTVGPFEITGPVAALILTPSRGIIEDGLIGTGFLRRFTVTFDYTRKQVWLDPNSRLRDQQPFDAAGWSSGATPTMRTRWSPSRPGRPVTTLACTKEMYCSRLTSATFATLRLAS